MNAGTGDIVRNVYGIFVVILCIALMIGCATPSKVPFEKTKELAPGMSYEEIILTLGEPETTTVVGNDWELAYYFYKGFPYNEWLPYKLVLDKNTRRLNSWALDEAQQQQDQATAQEWVQGLGLGGPPGSGGRTGGLPTAGAAVTTATPVGQAGGMIGGRDVAELVRLLSGTWKDFRSTGHTLITLEPNGAFAFYIDYATWGEFSEASGGEVTGNWGYGNSNNLQGTWSVTGTPQQGVITYQAQDGSQGTLKYQVLIEKGQTFWNEYYFDGVLYMRQE